MTAVIAVFRSVSTPAPRAGVLLSALPSSAPRLQRYGVARGPITPFGGGARSETNDDGCPSSILAA